MNAPITYRRAEVKTPDSPTIGLRGRFFFHNGYAALWEEDKNTRTARRILFGTNATFNKSSTPRVPHTVTFEGTEGEWTVRQLHGSGGCGCGNKPLTRLRLEQAVDPDFTELG